MQKKTQKEPFWRNKNRMFIFLLGAFFLATSISFLAIDGALTAFWKEAEITKMDSSRTTCKLPRSLFGEGSLNTYFYQVDDKEYSLAHCTYSAIPESIAYNPDNPSMATVRTLGTYQIVAIVVLIPAALMMIGAVFATDPKPGEKGYVPTKWK